MLCLECVNASNEILVEDEELKEELERVKREMLNVYKVVRFCKAKQAIVVGNPEKPTQTVTSCYAFSQM